MVNAVIVPIERVAVGMAHEQFQDQKGNELIDIEDFVQFLPTLCGVCNSSSGGEGFSVGLVGWVSAILIELLIDVLGVGLV